MNDEEQDIVLKRLKSNTDKYIERFGLLNILHRTEAIIKTQKFEGLEDQRIIHLKIALTIATKVHDALYFKRPVLIQDARPFKDGSIEVAMPVYYDYKKLVEYLGEMDKWTELFEECFDKLQKEGTISKLENACLREKVKEIVDDEFKIAVEKRLLIKKEELVKELFKELKN